MMPKTLVLCFLVFLSSASPAQKQSEPVLKNFGQPNYPPLARQARIQGQVNLEFVLNQNGDPVSVTILSGHPMLAPSAEAAVWTWQFQMPKSNSQDDLHLATTFNYEIDSVPGYSEASPPSPVFDSFHHVTVTAIPPVLGIDTAELLICPADPEATSRISDGHEFVELAYVQCYGIVHKLGTTPLMSAAAKREPVQVKRLLRSGSAVLDSDSSGWTALLYAAASNDEDTIKVLLSKGANPNQASFLGNTPLMISATRGELYETLLQAGANINAQNGAGTTTLMILAAQGASDEVASALKAGADPTFQDKMNRTALDYLHLANCGNSPIKERPKKTKALASLENCDERDQNDGAEIERLLRNATLHVQR